MDEIPEGWRAEGLWGGTEGSSDPAPESEGGADAESCPHPGALTGGLESEITPAVQVPGLGFSTPS